MPDVPQPFAFGRSVRCVIPLAKFNQQAGDVCTVGFFLARTPGFQLIDGRLCQIQRFEEV